MVVTRSVRYPSPTAREAIPFRDEPRLLRAAGFQGVPGVVLGHPIGQSAGEGRHRLGRSTSVDPPISRADDSIWKARPLACPSARRQLSCRNAGGVDVTLTCIGARCSETAAGVDLKRSGFRGRGDGAR